MDSAAYEHDAIRFAAPGAGVAWPPEGAAKARLDAFAAQLARQLARINKEFPGRHATLKVDFVEKRGWLSATMDTLFIDPQLVIGTQPLPEAVLESMLWHEMSHVAHEDSAIRTGLATLTAYVKDAHYIAAMRRTDPEGFARKAEAIYGSVAAYDNAARQVDAAMQKMRPVLQPYMRDPSDAALVDRLYHDAALKAQLQYLKKVSGRDPKMRALAKQTEGMQQVQAVTTAPPEEQLAVLKAHMSAFSPDLLALEKFRCSLARATEYRADDFAVMHEANPADYAPHQRHYLRHIGHANYPLMQPQEKLLLEELGLDGRTHPPQHLRTMRCEALAAQLGKQGIFGPRTQETALRTVNRMTAAHAR